MGLGKASARYVTMMTDSASVERSWSLPVAGSERAGTWPSCERGLDGDGEGGFWDLGYMGEVEIG